MPVSPLVLELLEKAAESGLSAEEVCKDSPHLIDEVRACLRHLSSVRDELDALFPEEALESPGPSSPRPEIPGYRVGDIVGRGGMGVVYRAHHLRLNRPVALKMMLNGGFAGPPELARFQQEAEALAALQHPNIVQVFDVGESGGLPYFTMEFLSGGSLAQKLGGVPLSARDAASLMITMADAIESAHRGGIVHRDLKPSNILLTAGGTPKVTDFGLARRIEVGLGLSMTAMRIGTPGYMAPEQVTGQARVSGVATDVYSLGAIFYEMLTGRPPFRAETAAETDRQVLAEEPAPPTRLNAKVPGDLETICLKCLQKEPRRRYSSAAELGEDIGRSLRGEPIQARPASAAERAGKWMRRHPTLTLTMFGALTIAIALFVGGWWTLSSRTLVTHAIEDDLRTATQALHRSDWGEARSALERARGRLGPGGRDALRLRLDRAGRDLELARQLAALRLDRITGTEEASPRWPVEYEKVFREAGLFDMEASSRIVADRIGGSDIKDALVAAIDDWALCAYVADDRRAEAWLLEVARETDPDPQGWRDRLRDPSVRRDQRELARLAGSARMEGTPVNLLAALGELLWRTESDALPFLKAVQRHHPNDIMVSCLLGYDALNRKDMPEAIRHYQTALAIRPGTPFLYGALGQALARDGKWVEAIPYYDDAVRLDPDDEVLRRAFGDCLARSGRFAEAAVHYSRALELTRGDRWRGLLRANLRACQLRAGNLEAADSLWRESLETAPPDDPAREGYAEFCLFRGRMDEYRTACGVLLRQDGATDDARRAERAGRACLLTPATNGMLEEATALIDRALADQKPELAWARPYFMVSKGLAEYRRGRLEGAMAIMDGPASTALQPAPRLVSAMALHRLGRKEEAIRALAAAIRAGDWEKTHANDREKWVYHILRREAEALLLPNLQAFLDDKYRPPANDERLCLLGACRFEGRYRAAAELHAEILASDPRLAEDLNDGARFRAACAAALAGSRRDLDALGLGESGRLRWRGQARDWLRADLALLRKLMKSNAGGVRGFLEATLNRWLAEPDLAP